MKVSSLYTNFNPRIKTLFKIYSVMYWLIYLIKSFAIWEFTNPFRWIFDLSSDSDLRIGILMGVFIALVISIVLYGVFLNKDGKFK